MPTRQTWLERVRAGLPITPDPAFLEAIFVSKDKEQAYNSERDYRHWQGLLEDWWGKVGEGVIVLPTITVDVGFNIEIGARSFLNVNCTLLDTYPIRIGSDVMVGPNCAIYAVGHPLKASER